MRDVLKLVAEIGDAPGEHHFFIEYITGAPGVEVPDFLREEYPERMTIVLQHQFDNLTVEDDRFAVTLWFKGKQTELSIPYNAVTSFADPSVQFGVRFEPAENANADENAPKPNKQTSANEDPDEAASSGSDDSVEPKGDGADIVSLDAFRKK